MTREHWQRMAGTRIDDAKALLRASQWSGAYYLAGYAVECGLKACIVKRVGAKPELIFRDREFARRCWTHAAEELVALADLKAARDADVEGNPIRDQSWQFVRTWTEADRYEVNSSAAAKQLFNAVANVKHGVLPWIKSYW